ATYRVELPAGVKAAQGQTQTTSIYSANFTVIPPPTVANTNPANGEQFADPYQGLDITFSGPISPASVIVGQTLLVEPAISATEVYTYWSQNDTQVNISFARKENSVYTVTLTPGIVGRYGQPLAEPTTISWKTYRQTPYVHIVSPSIATYNGYRAETYVYMTVRNVSQVNFALYRLNRDEFVNLSQNVFAGFDDYNQWESFTPPQDRRVGEWSQTTDPELYENYVYKVDVSQAVAGGQPLAPGLYFLVAQAAPSGIYPESQGADLTEASDRQLLIVSKRSLILKQGQGDALAWLTDLQSGQPVGNAPISFVAGKQNPSQTQTDSEGVATSTFTQPPLTEPAISVIAFTGNPDQPDDNFAVSSSSWSSGINSYEFDGIYPGFGGFGSSGGYTGYIYPERPLYRPGQTVNFKGIIRADDDARYSLPPVDKPVTVQITDFQGRQIYSQSLTLNGWGTFNGLLVLGDQAGVGAYSQVQYDNASFYGQFQVAAYRKPDYVVTVQTDKSEYRQGETIKVNAATEFFSGGPVSKAKVLDILTEPYNFQYPGSGYYDFLDSDELRHRLRPIYLTEKTLHFAAGTAIAGRFLKSARYFSPADQPELYF
ncbi:MAG: MG2 domain-containing protein, partial [Anaerolineae bacterium]